MVDVFLECTKTHSKKSCLNSFKAYIKVQQKEKAGEINHRELRTNVGLSCKIVRDVEKLTA